MKKLRTDAAWAKLTKKQSNQLKNWLFDDKLGYAQAHERAKQEFGYGGSVSSVRRFYYRACEEQMEEDLLEANETAEHFAETPVKDEVLRKSAVRMLVAVLQRQLVLEPEKAREWAWLARLAVKCEDQEIWREGNRIQEDRNLLREKAMEQQQARWEYDQIKMARKMLPQLKELERAERRKKGERDEQEYGVNKKMNEIRRGVFGDFVMKNPLPESAEHEAVMREEKLQGKPFPGSLYDDKTGAVMEAPGSHEETKEVESKEGDSTSQNVTARPEPRPTGEGAFDQGDATNASGGRSDKAA